MSDPKDSYKRGLFRWFRSPPTPVPSDDSSSASAFNDDLWNAIKISSPSEVRISKLNQLSQVIQNTEVEHSVIEKLWLHTKDLLNPSISLTLRTSYFRFLILLIKSHQRPLGILKALLYQDIKDRSYKHQEDILNIMLIINYLTDEGKNLCMMEQEVM